MQLCQSGRTIRQPETNAGRAVVPEATMLVQFVGRAALVEIGIIVDNRLTANTNEAKGRSTIADEYRSKDCGEWNVDELHCIELFLTQSLFKRN